MNLRRNPFKKRKRLWFGIEDRRKGWGGSAAADMETWVEGGLVVGGWSGMIWAFLQRGAQQRRAPGGTQPSPRAEERFCALSDTN
jgi:hypothetical protein